MSFKKPGEKKRGPARTKQQREADQHTILTMWKQGIPLHEIGKAHGVTSRTIYNDLAKARKDWLSRNDVIVAEYVADQMLKIDHLEEVAWKAYLRSCEDASRVQKKTKGGEASSDEETTVTKWGRLGDPRYMDQVRWCIEQRLKLIGAYAPEKHMDVTPLPVIEIEIDSREDYIEYKNARDRITFSDN